MKSALLCNGPSRVAYKGREGYDYVLGCNFPWTEVDATTVLDIPVVEIWNKDRTVIPCKAYFSEASWRTAKQLDEEFFTSKFINEVKVQTNWHSSGHVGAEILISKGYTEIDVYGCDAWFGNADSFTRAFIPIDSPNRVLRAHSKLIEWRLRWNILKEENPNVKLNFIRAPK